jgi:aminoglycoside 3-N-acetyltransferase
MNGVFPEFLRTTPGARRSANPGASITAIGARADWLTADHRLDYGYGPGTPLARLVVAGAKVLMLGAPLDTMTLMHHAEHLAAIPDKVVRRYEVRLAATPEWQWVEEFDTSEPCSPRLPENFIEEIVAAYLAAGKGRRGRVGDADCVLVGARDICAFGVRWIEATAG